MMKKNMMVLSMNRKLVVKECGNQAEIVDLWKYYNSSGVTRNHICKLIKYNKYTFEGDMPNIRTDMNHNLLMQTI